MKYFYGALVLAAFLISFECNASKVKYWKGEAEGEISTEAYFTSDTHSGAVAFVLYCDKESGSEYSGSLSVSINYREQPTDQLIKSDALSFLSYKMDRAYDKLLKGKGETMSLCLNSKCSPHKWQFGEMDSDIMTTFIFNKNNKIGSLGISSDSVPNAIFAKLDLNKAMAKLCALKSSKRTEYSEE
jgi:hypothetical protein